MSVQFKLRTGEIQEVECFAAADKIGMEEKVLKIRAPEFVSSVTGYHNNYFIEYLRIVSSRGNYIMAGSDKNQAKCRKFEFDIKKEEKPIAFFGIVDKINVKKRKGHRERGRDSVTATAA